jgi:hypothetical protein
MYNAILDNRCGKHLLPTNDRNNERPLIESHFESGLIQVQIAARHSRGWVVKE